MATRSVRGTVKIHPRHLAKYERSRSIWSMSNNIIGAIGSKFALVPGRNHRGSLINSGRLFTGSSRNSRRLHRAPRRPTPSAASISSLRDKWREESDRRNLEGAGLIFYVKFIGVDVVDGPYDEIGCHKILTSRRRRRRRRKVQGGQQQSSFVLISVTSTSIKIIQHQWVVEFEHAVTAVSTCYTDHQRLRLFAYIVKDYTTGSHFCMAFKTVKRSGITGKRLQRVFGYAFDSCYTPSLLLSSDDVSSINESNTTTAELKRCLQICNYSQPQSRGILKSNSNFSSVFEAERAHLLTQSPSHTFNDTTLNHKRKYKRPNISNLKDDVLKVCEVKNDVNSASNSKIHHRHTVRKHTKSRFNGQRVEPINICQVTKPSAAVKTDYDLESLTKFYQPATTVQDLNHENHNICQCHMKMKGTMINRSLSDSLLHFKYHSHYKEELKLPSSNNCKQQAILIETSPLTKDVTVSDSKQLNAECLDIPSSPRTVSLTSCVNEQEKADILQRKGSISSVISNNVIILLTSSSSHRVETDSSKSISPLLDSNDETPILTHGEQIKRQVAYLNLPTHDITTAYPNIPESNYNDDMVLPKHKACSKCELVEDVVSGEMVDFRASLGFDSITQLSQKLTQIAQSVSNELLSQKSIPNEMENSQAIFLYSTGHTCTSDSDATTVSTLSQVNGDPITVHTLSQVNGDPITVHTLSQMNDDATNIHTLSNDTKDMIDSTHNEIENESIIRGSPVTNSDCITHGTSPAIVLTGYNTLRMTSPLHHDSTTTHCVDRYNNMNNFERGSQLVVNGGSFLCCESCSRSISTEEAQRHISRMLTMIFSSLQLATAVSMEPVVTSGEDKTHAPSTSSTATWE